ncbi:MAG: GMC family oxidoreductase [Deltaproteobacteria bacterium]|nr:GMC family oxidoreductase [Deltaproteobacteria bacterium]
MSGPSCDVLVIGSGAGGATAALALAQQGVDVIVVEKGPFYTLADFERDELAVCRRNFFVPFVSDEPNLMRYQASAEYRKTNDGWTACCVGGGTVHMSGFFYRMHEDDFRLRTALGAVADSEIQDWPIGYRDLEPYYDRAEVLLGVSGRAGENPFDVPRRHDYPLPPLLEHPIARRLDAVAGKLGWHTFATPRAILSRAYDGRPRCTYSGLCGNYGCETGAKSSALSALLPKAIATGRCRVFANRCAIEVTVDNRGRASGAVLIDRGGRRDAVTARAVCVAAGAIQSARLLLNSRSGRFPRGLANNGDRVGRHLCFNTLALVEAELLRTGGGAEIEGFDDRLPWLGRSVQDFYWYEKGGARIKGGTVRFDLVHPNPIYNAEQVAVRQGKLTWGPALKQGLRRRFLEGKTLEAEIFGEFLPNAETRVEVDDAVRDVWGAPVARVTLVHHPRNLEVADFLADRARELFNAMGSEQVDTILRGATYVLQNGTCCFGRDPARSVLDPSCRCHEVDNLYVVDGSCLPSSGGVPITLTIHANALRVGDLLAGRMRRREL